VTDTKSTTRTRNDGTYGIELIREWVPPNTPEIATIVLVHGIAEHSGRYERSGELLARNGFKVVAPDLFGFGQSGGDRADIERWDDYWGQVERLVEAAESPVILMGHSMGGLIALSYALSGRTRPQLLVLSAPAIGGGAAWQKAVAPVIARLAPGMLIPNGLKGEQLSRDPEVAEAYFADPLVFLKTTARLGNHLFSTQADVASTLGNLSIPTLVMHGGADTIVPPVSTAALGEIDVVERRLYPKLRHEILNEPEGPDLVAEIVEWVIAQLKA
jgi:acylglycerol lipase